VPYIDTVYVHWLRMKLYTKDGGVLRETNVVLAREAITGATILSFAGDQLPAVACMEHFGEDTGEWVTTTIKRDDPRIQGIAGEPPARAMRR